MAHVISSREKTISFITIAVIISVFFYNILAVPLADKYRVLNAKIGKQELELNKAYHLIENRDRIENEYKGLFSKAKEDEGKKSKDEIIYGTLREMQNAIKYANLTLTDIKPELTKKIEGHEVVPLVMKAEGTINEIAKFLHYIGNSMNFVSIETFQISPKNTASPKLELKLTINRFIF